MNNDDIQRLGNELKEVLNMHTSPVAVHLVKADEDIPADIPHIGDTTRHCQMVDNVRRLGTQFYATLDDQMCKGGAAVMGLSEMSPKLKSGEVYYNLNHFNTLESAKATMEKVPMVKANTIRAVIYAPLEKATFMPDVVLVIANPKTIMELAQALLHKPGGRVTSGFAGKQSVCADGVAYPYLTGEAGVTVGCSGSRKYTEIQDEEMIMSIPINMLTDLVESAKSMFGSYAC